MIEYLPAPKAGRHGWAGACDPGPSPGWRLNMFSVGCFEYLPAKSGGLKRSPVKVRVKGSSSHPELVYKKAAEVCRLLDAGLYSGPKIITVKN